MNTNKKMNLPNYLTLLRLVLVPVIIVLMLVQYYSPTVEVGNIPVLWICVGAIFVIASFTDWLDGYLARKNNQVTEFGKFFDPIADKLLVNSTLILFSVVGILPVWITLILILRDVIVDFIRMVLSSKNITLAAGIWGKLKTTFQMIGLTILFFANTYTLNVGEFSWENQLLLIPMYIAVGFSLYSGISYFIKARTNLF